jgi:hypothetical protein
MLLKGKANDELLPLLSYFFAFFHVEKTEPSGSSLYVLNATACKVSISKRSLNLIMEQRLYGWHHRA